MRAAAILGLGCSLQDLRPFQKEKTVEWRMGLPSAPGPADIIVMFGGDGTVHRHLGQLVKLGLPVLIVPAGSGNDFAASLGLRRVRDSVAAWQRFCSVGSNVRAIDLGVITPLGETGGTASLAHASALGSRYFSCVAGVGLDGEVSRRANRLPRWLRGHGGYVLSMLPTIFTFVPVPMKILTHAENSTADKLEWTVRKNQPTLLAAFANIPSYGGGMEIAPKASMDDGLLDVCIVGGVGPFKLFCLFPTVYAGRHLSIRQVDYFQTSCVRVETEYPLDVYADGEYVCRTPVEVSIQRAALHVVTPSL